MTADVLASAIDGPADAPVLVLANSLGTTCDVWVPQLALLEGEWRVVRFDHPGHGGSPVWEGPVMAGRIGLAVCALLDQQGIDRVSFCGLSLGGAVGQWVAAYAPERVERLVLVSTSAAFAARETYLQRAATVRAHGMEGISGPVVDRWFTPEFRAQQPVLVARYRAMLEGIPPEGYAACCEAVAGFDGRDDLAAIIAPTLVIAGAEDRATPMEHARALVAGIPGARLLAIQRAAHLANVEQPVAVGEAIVQHLRREYA